MFMHRLSTIALLAMGASFLSAAECNRCIEIRKENEHKTFNDGYTYYEDYLENNTDNAIAPPEENPSHKEPSANLEDEKTP